MEAWVRGNERAMIAATRQKPRGRPILYVKAVGLGECRPGDGAVPGELHLEATDDGGEPADWFDDYWWVDVLQRWQEHPLAIHILATPGALLHPVVLHQMDMLRRVASHWRRIGHCHVDDVITDDAMQRLAVSPYDEVRVLDAFRPGAGKSAAERRDVRVERLFGQVLRLQAASGATRPILIRVPPPPADERVFSSAVFDTRQPTHASA
jgi:hypothetical protein